VHFSILEIMERQKKEIQSLYKIVDKIKGIKPEKSSSNNDPGSELLFYRNEIKKYIEEIALLKHGVGMNVNLNEHASILNNQNSKYSFHYQPSEESVKEKETFKLDLSSFPDLSQSSQPNDSGIDDSSSVEYIDASFKEEKKKDNWSKKKHLNNQMEIDVGSSEMKPSCPSDWDKPTFLPPRQKKTVSNNNGNHSIMTKEFPPLGFSEFQRAPQNHPKKKKKNNNR
jgi:hypothetical protein